MPTPVNAERLERWLYDYDPDLKQFVVDGFTFGFNLGFEGISNQNINIRNLNSTLLHPMVCQNIIEKELSLNRFLGPFEVIPFEHFNINPMGVVPKKEKGSFRLIIDLSQPKNNSINSGIPEDYSKVKYSSLYTAIDLIIQCGPGAYMAKSDVESAFRLLPISPDQYHLLGFSFNNLFYFDKCLPMGASSSCFLFEKFSSSLEFIAIKAGVSLVTHYLDDFFFTNSTFEDCNKDLSIFQSVCKDINIPLSSKKTVGPTQILSFLGFEIDTIAETVRLPQDKVDKCLAWINWMLVRKQCQLKDMQSLLGLLNFTCTVIRPGKAFLNRLYQLTAHITKSFHYIRLSSDCKKDLRMWLLFLNNYNGVTLYKHELFIDSDTSHLYADACKTCGFGAYFQTHWFSLSYPSDWYREQNITLLELLPIVLGIEAWKDALVNKTLIIHTDNQPIFEVINRQTSKEQLVMLLIRKLVLICVYNNIYIKAQHISGIDNYLADDLSRFQVNSFKKKFPNADLNPTQVPSLPDWLSCDVDLWN